MLFRSVETFTMPEVATPVMNTTSTEQSVVAQVENVTPIEPVAIETPATEAAPVSIEMPAEVPVVNKEEVVSTDTVQEPVVATVATEDALETPEATNLDKTMVSVYGGESPMDKVATSVVEEAPKSIYGGNDPLEATQNLPKVEEDRKSVV